MSDNKSNTAQVTGRVLIFGDLVLDAPLLIGAGDGGDDRNADEDIRVLKGKEGPFIPGTSLCGVLREFLRTHEPTQKSSRETALKSTVSPASASMARNMTMKPWIAEQAVHSVSSSRAVNAIRKSGTKYTTICSFCVKR